MPLQTVALELSVPNIFDQKHRLCAVVGSSLRHVRQKLGAARTGFMRSLLSYIPPITFPRKYSIMARANTPPALESCSRMYCRNFPLKAMSALPVHLIRLHFGVELLGALEIISVEASADGYIAVRLYLGYCHALHPLFLRPVEV